MASYNGVHVRLWRYVHKDVEGLQHCYTQQNKTEGKAKSHTT